MLSICLASSVSVSTPVLRKSQEPDMPWPAVRARESEETCSFDLRPKACFDFDAIC